MSLSSWRIVYKLFLLVGILTGVTLFVSAEGIFTIQDISEGASEVDLAGDEALLGARLNQNVLALNRAEFRLALDPSTETMKAVETFIAGERGVMEKRLVELKATADSRQKEMLDAVERAYKIYMPELNATLATAKRNGAEVTVNDAQKAIRDSAMTSRAKAEVLRDAVQQYADYSADKAGTIAGTVKENGDRARSLMLVVASLGVLGGIVVGYLLAQYAIAKPIAAAVGCLRRLAGGDVSVSIYGIGRKDEIGDIAATMQVFKDNLIRNREMEEQATAAEARAAADRKQAMNSMADQFEAQVKTMVQLVASAATELQSNAASLSSMAEQSRSQATAVAASTEQTAANVQTVAASAEEMAGSIGEISRQVGQSARVC
ncbi:MAG TPA: methyl-accepting chemotaxis protein [Azospirillaceae bacterium]|nr:methyl-accepting chemotaxis protein [Azospirillaceae bacterium]